MTVHHHKSGAVGPRSCGAADATQHVPTNGVDATLRLGSGQAPRVPTYDVGAENTHRRRTSRVPIKLLPSACPSRRGCRNQTGFMLLEVVLAVFLLSICLFALIDSLGRCVAAARSVQSYSTSEVLLANKCFEFRVERDQDILDQEGQFPDYPGYSWSRRLESTETEGLWQQTVTVYWYERGQIASDSVVEYKYLPDKQR